MVVVRTSEQQPSNMDNRQNLISNIPIPPQLDMSGNKDQNWRNWKQLWDSFEIASGLVQQDKKYRVAMLITCIAVEVLQVYNNLPFDSEEDRLLYACKALAPMHVMSIATLYFLFETSISG